jgi:ABC-type nitrate/sulfonate/bicarbonate transport system substrate-binding protein
MTCRGTTAIAAGDVEAIHIMGTAIRGIIQGLPMKVLAVNQKLPLFWLVTRPELKTFNDLRGKTMAVTTIGGSQQLAGFHMLRKGGIDPAKEVTSIVSGDVPAQLQAQVSGPVHITVLSPPTVFVARDRYKLNLLAAIGDDYVNFISGLIVSDKTLQQSPGSLSARSALWQSQPIFSCQREWFSRNTGEASKCIPADRAGHLPLQPVRLYPGQHPHGQRSR